MTPRDKQEQPTIVISFRFPLAFALDWLQGHFGVESAQLWRQGSLQ